MEQVIRKMKMFNSADFDLVKVPQEYKLRSLSDCLNTEKP